jgi:hypothetical protein
VVTRTESGPGAGDEDLPHLHEAAQRIARLPDQERLRYVRADRWIGYPRATEAIERLETLLTWPEKRSRGCVIPRRYDPRQYRKP